jgi:predicted transposase/invertase (TIGR01784 family)
LPQHERRKTAIYYSLFYVIIVSVSNFSGNKKLMKINDEKAIIRKLLSEDDGRLYGLLYDVVFKSVFGHRKNTRLLAILLNALLQLEGDKKIKSLIIQNPFSYQQFKSDKISIIDIKATDISGEQYCVEVQMRGHQALMERIIYYGSSRYAGQIRKGDNYDELKKTVSLWILQEQFLPDTEKEIHNSYVLQNEKTHHQLTDLVEYHFIELHKFNENVSLRSSFERWLHVLKFGDRYTDLENIPEELLQEEGVMEALATMKEVNSNKKARETIFLRNMHLSDVATIEKRALHKGIGIGRDEERKISNVRLEEERKLNNIKLAEERRLREEERRLREALEKELAELKKKSD